MLFADRREAGRTLAGELQEYAGKDIFVLALPRGGVVVAAEVAEALKAPLDLVIARKIGHPSWEEYAIGAVTEAGPPVWNELERRMLDPAWLEHAAGRERQEAKRRREAYIGGRPLTDVRGKHVLLVDDGIATGLTMQAAIAELKQKQPEKIVVAVPVAPLDVAQGLTRYSEKVIVVHAPAHGFESISNYYRHFDQLTDTDVQRIMQLFVREV